MTARPPEGRVRVTKGRQSNETKRRVAPKDRHRQKQMEGVSMGSRVVVGLGRHGCLASDRHGGRKFSELPWMGSDGAAAGSGSGIRRHTGEGLDLAIAPNTFRYSTGSVCRGEKPRPQGSSCQRR